MMNRLLLSVVPFLLGACAAGPANLKKSAAADLGCPSKELQLEQLDKSKAGTTWLVTGCGKTAQYSVARKVVTRTTEIAAYTPPAPALAAPAPAPPPSSSPEQQARLNAFMANHNQQMADTQAQQKAFFANTGPKPPAPAPAPAPAPQPAAPSQPVASAPAEPAPSPSTTAEQAGWVCLNTDYYACPDSASTMALGGYAACRMKCMMGGGKCSSCVVGAGERCVRQPSRDAECKQ